MTSSLFLSVRIPGIPLEREGRFAGRLLFFTSLENWTVGKQCDPGEWRVKERDVDTVVHSLIPNKCLAAVQRSYVHKKKSLSIFFKESNGCICFLHTAAMLYTEILELLLCFRSFYLLLFAAVELSGFGSTWFHALSVLCRKPLSYSLSF